MTVLCALQYCRVSGRSNQESSHSCKAMLDSYTLNVLIIFTPKLLCLYAGQAMMLTLATLDCVMD